MTPRGEFHLVSWLPVVPKTRHVPSSMNRKERHEKSQRFFEVQMMGEDTKNGAQVLFCHNISNPLYQREPQGCPEIRWQELAGFSPMQPFFGHSLPPDLPNSHSSFQAFSHLVWSLGLVWSWSRERERERALEWPIWDPSSEERRKK